MLYVKSEELEDAMLDHWGYRWLHMKHFASRMNAAVMALVSLNVGVIVYDVDTCGDGCAGSTSQALEAFGHVCCALFFVECIIRNWVMGPRLYFEKLPNVLDAFLVFFSILDLWILR